MQKNLTQVLVVSLLLAFLLSCSGKAENGNDVILQVNNLPDSITTTNRSDEGANEIYFPGVDEKKSFTFDGFLRLKTDLGSDVINTISIYSADESHFGYFLMKDIEPSFKGAVPFSIESYYPEFYVVVFKADSMSSNRYPIRVNGTTKYIKHVNGVTVYETVQEHLYTSYIGTSNDNPLREQPSFKSDLVVKELDYSELSFEIKNIKGNWALVMCNADCEGCPEGNTSLSGWVKVLNKGKIIVNLYYIC